MQRNLLYSGEQLKNYPEHIETGYYIVAFIEFGTFLLVFIAMLLTFCGDSEQTSALSKCAFIVNETCLILGQWGSLTAVIYLLYQAFTTERAIHGGLK